MLSTAIIIFRETLEIAMILGVVLAATRGLAGRTKWVIGGFMAGVAGAALVAVFAEAISASASGMGQEFFNAMILFTAAIVIGWTAVWIRKNARLMTAHLRQVGHDVAEGKLPLYSLSLIIGLALLREGSEIVLFIYGMALSGQSAASIAEGSAVGLGLGIIVGVMLYYGLLRIPARHVLQVTSWLLVLLVAGLAAQGAGYLLAAGYFPRLSWQVWDSSWLLSDDGIIGKSLHSLVGYTARPAIAELLVYIVTLGGLLGIIARMDRADKKHLALMAATLLSLAGIATAKPAMALDEIYSPNIEQGEFSVEYGGSRTFDHHSDQNNVQEHELALEYAVQNHWLLEASAGFAKDPGTSMKLEDVEVESRFQFFDQGEKWVDSGLLVAYGMSTQSHSPDSLEIKLLLEKDTGMFTHRANIGFEQEIGKDAEGGPDFVFLWNSRYRYSPNFQPGIEIQSDLGQGKVLDRFSEQEHYVGPAVYGELIPHLKYQAAYLFGVSQTAAQGAARVLLEYELQF